MPTQLNPYLNFDGNTREAMEFYHSVLGGKLELHTFEELNGVEDPADKNKIMHSMVQADNGVTFMAADIAHNWKHEPGRNISMSLSGDNEPELRGYFEKLSEGGTVEQPLVAAPWGDTFGMLTDKFGIRWMVNITGQKAA